MKTKRYFMNLTALVGFALMIIAQEPFAFAADMTADDFIAEAKKSITTISINEAKNIHDNGGAIFLDCREPNEYKAGHIPGAINLPRGLLEFKIEKEISDKNSHVVVYCKSGGRSCLGAYTLFRMGYKNVKSMDGGWKAWLEAGYPAE